ILGFATSKEFNPWLIGKIGAGFKRSARQNLRALHGCPFQKLGRQARLANAGLIPKVHASAGKTRFGHMRKQANQYLKWAFR
ncbi:MAG: transposase, partial [Anaerolineae bacterium]|nr:transposase [Anaerolineae bacterium]